MEIPTLDALVEAMEGVPIQPRPDVNVLYYISDWKSYVDTKLSKERLSHHSGYHCFKITEEESKVCFRGKVLSTDEKWYPKQGIQLLIEDPKLGDPIEASEFRFDHKRMKTIIDDIQVKYLPMLEAERRQETEASWKALAETFQKLELERKSLKPISFCQLPKYRPPASPDSTGILTRKHVNATSLWGTFYPDEVEEGNVKNDAKIGLDVVIFTHAKASRPWVGVISEISNDNLTYKIQWYKRAPGGGIRYRKNIRDGKAYFSDVEAASVMLYSVADHLDDGDLDLSEWYEKVMATYMEHDECY